ncbi:hypothetical protein SESBI_40438 [Sesbania bispinosa]|nr:hypothetical protein SESBI_40438 [Sesbania bispinosa]
MENIKKPSSEEEDLLDRSTKKVKLISGFEDNKVLSESGFPGTQNPSEQPIRPSKEKPSYKDMVISSKEVMEEDPEEILKAACDVPIPTPLTPKSQEEEVKVQEDHNLVSKDSADQANLISKDQASNMFGPWMIAKKPQRKRPLMRKPDSSKEKDPQKGPSNGSRFDLLADDHQVEEIADKSPQPAPSQNSNSKDTQSHFGGPGKSRAPKKEAPKS